MLLPTNPLPAALIESWYRAALAAVEPGAAVRRHLERDGRTLLVAGESLPVPGRLLVVAVGKAAVGMARTVEDICGGLIADGIVITKDGHAAPPLPSRMPVQEAAHPIPDERGVRATRQALNLLATATPDDVVLALISGGGSALLEAPRPPVTLADLAATTDLLLRAGAPISDLNAVRVPLSMVKGGGLRWAAPRSRFATLVLSDVLGSDPRVIASGPTVPTSFTPAGALTILDRYNVRDRGPATVVACLLDDRSISVGNLAGNDYYVVVSDNSRAVEAISNAARSAGLTADVVWHDRQGEAADLGREWVARCAEAPPDLDVLLGGGEATVTVRGDGQGGRNTEFALAAALALAERNLADWTVASLASDGQDALTGVAGAVADAGTVARATANGVDPVVALRNNDSLRVFQSAGGLIALGPTGTNVADLYFAVRSPRG